MESPFFMRFTILTGAEAAATIENCRVIIFGLGGVGSWCAEALARSGIGKISLVDGDIICATNINRQVQALSSNIGRNKAEVLEERLREINPSCEVKAYPCFYSKENAAMFDIPEADFVIDAIDSLTNKLDLIEAACSSGRGFFSSMGMAQKLDPALVKTADIWATSGCPLARLVRQGLKKRNFTGHFRVVYSEEKVRNNECASSMQHELSLNKDNGKNVMGSSVTVTATAGMLLASLVLRAIIDGCPGSSIGGCHG